jgi:16S rRNA (uracil1498-N3)-methyltransferase
MHRFFIDQKIEGSRVNLTDEEKLHYMLDVLRLKKGDEVLVFNGGGREYRCMIEGIEKGLVSLKIRSVKEMPAMDIKLTVACAVPKQSRMDDIVDKLTQLGVDEIIPLETERVVVKIGDKRNERLQRWNRIAESAAEQSCRSTLPHIPGILNMREMIDYTRNGYDLRIIPHLEGKKKPIKSVIDNNYRRILAAIGPEGDFTPEEVSEAVSAGFVPVSLGDCVLRVDTAAVAAAAYLRFAVMT